MISDGGNNSSTNLEHVRVYVVYTNSDLTEGRGRKYVLAYTTSITHAKRLAHRNYVQGSDCPIEEATLWKIGEKHFPLNSEVILMNPEKEDLVKDEKIVTYTKLISKATSLGLTSEEIELLKKGNGWIG